MWLILQATWGFLASPVPGAPEKILSIGISELFDGRVLRWISADLSEVCVLEARLMSVVPYLSLSMWPLQLYFYKIHKLWSAVRMLLQSSFVSICRCCVASSYCYHCLQCVVNSKPTPADNLFRWIATRLQKSSFFAAQSPVWLTWSLII